MKKLKIETLKGEVVYTRKRKRIEVEVPHGMYGEEYRQFKHDNKILIKRFKN